MYGVNLPAPGPQFNAFASVAARIARHKKGMRGQIFFTPDRLRSAVFRRWIQSAMLGSEIIVPAPGGMPPDLELLEYIPSSVGWIVAVERVLSAVIDLAVRLRAIGRIGTGVNNLPLERIGEAGLRLMPAEGANANSVAEFPRRMR